MRAAFGVEALVGYTQALDGTAGDEVLGDNLRRVRWLDVAVPDRFRIDHDHGAVLTLVQAAGFVDAHATAQAGGFGPPLEFGVQIAGSIGGAGGTRCALGARLVANKDVAFKGGHGLSPVASWIPILAATKQEAGPSTSLRFAQDDRRGWGTRSSC